VSRQSLATTAFPDATLGVVNYSLKIIPLAKLEKMSSPAAHSGRKYHLKIQGNIKSAAVSRWRRFDGCIVLFQHNVGATAYGVSTASIVTFAR
jgi:hypothetical protein